MPLFAYISREGGPREITIHAVFGPFPTPEVAAEWVTVDLSPFHDESPFTVSEPAGEVTVHVLFGPFPTLEVAGAWADAELAPFFGAARVALTGPSQEVVRVSFHVERDEAGAFLYRVAQ